jgi:hypothetical protein
MMLQAKAKAGGTLGVKLEEVSANSKMGVFAPPPVSEKAPQLLSEDLSEGPFLKKKKQSSNMVTLCSKCKANFALGYFVFFLRTKRS